MHETEDLSDCSSKEEEGKPTRNALKKTFTSLLSKIYLGKATDGSSLTDTDSNCGGTSNHKKVPRKIHCFVLGKPKNKSFTYFASSLGRGFIISDDEEITGVISVRNKVAIVPSKDLKKCDLFVEKEAPS